ncbi:MAG: hypothetical protein H0U75_12450 [Legionella sp.]|nr:hypothetical protein [Legionella sp.]
MIKYIINKTAGIFLGSIKGIFISTVWANIQMHKSFTGDLIALFKKPKIFCLLLPGYIAEMLCEAIMATIYGLVRGLFFGCYVGAKGGVLSTLDKKAPIHDLYVVMKAWSAATSLDNLFVSQPIYTYLDRHYLGFSESRSDSEGNLIIKELLKNPLNNKTFRKFFEAKLSWCTTPEFIALKNVQFLSLVVDYVYERQTRKKLLKILFDNGLTVEDFLHAIPGLKLKYRNIIMKTHASYEAIKDKETMVTFCLASKRSTPSLGLLEGNISKPIEIDFFESPLFDKNIIKLLGSYVSGETKEPPNELKIMSDNKNDEGKGIYLVGDKDYKLSVMV